MLMAVFRNRRWAAAPMLGMARGGPPPHSMERLQQNLTLCGHFAFVFPEPPRLPIFQPLQQSALYFAAPSWELATLSHLHRVLEEQLPAMLQRYAVSPELTRDRRPGPPPDLQLPIIESSALPAARGPLLISAYTVVETCYVDISASFASRLSLKYSIGSTPKLVPGAVSKRWQHMSVLVRARHFFPCELDLEPFATEDEYTSLDSLRLLRNALAHSGGRRHAMSIEKWRALTMRLDGVPGVNTSQGAISVSAEYVRETLSSVSRTISAFCARARVTLTQKRLDD